MNARLAILQGRILPTLFRLGWPNLVVFLLQALVAAAELFFVGFLGTAALAGVAVVIPILTLMTMMSHGGIGGGVSSAVARALGAGRRDRAEAIVIHAIVLAALFGAAFTIGMSIGGPALYRLLGASAAALDNAVGYSAIVFAGAIAGWMTNLLSAALRGSGNMIVPARVAVGSTIMLGALTPALVFGWGPFPALGVAGAATALVVYYVGSALFLLWYLLSGRGPLRVKLVPLDRSIFADILRVGGVSAIGAVQMNLTVVLVTGIVGRFGTHALAGYAIATRLDYLLLPILFSLGVAVVTMVGLNVGANQVARAKRITWIAALLAFAVTEAVGLAAAFFPGAWVGLFSSDPAVRSVASLYLASVAPVYGLFGLGMALYFGGQGAGFVAWPFVAGATRLLVAAVLGWVGVALFGAGLAGLFLIVAAATAAFGLINAIVISVSSWTRRARGSVAPPRAQRA